MLTLCMLLLLTESVLWIHIDLLKAENSFVDFTICVYFQYDFILI